jgi:serine protease AprX
MPTRGAGRGQRRTTQLPARTAEIQWNIEKVAAPFVWAEGYTGEGVVIGGQDTGYEWGHPALMNQYRGWNGIEADHSYSWHDAIREDLPESMGVNRCGLDSPAPCDDDGHGTHTMGTMLGDDGAGTQIGVAPRRAVDRVPQHGKRLGNAGYLRRML